MDGRAPAVGVKRILFKDVQYSIEDIGGKEESNN